MKLTNHQKRVIELMKEGWELGFNLFEMHTYPKPCLMVYKKTHEGEEMKYVHTVTLDALDRRKLLKHESVYHRKYALSDLGKTIEL